MKVTLSFVAALALVAIFLSATTLSYDNDPWVVPDKYKNMKNPQEANAESLKTGKQLWNKHCGSCHGKEGLGDGSKAAQLDTPCGDFSAAEFHAQSDGSLFYKTKFGRDEMPGYEKKIPYDEDIWHVVNFMRTLK